MQKRLTILVPVFNEVENLERLQREFLSFFKIAKVPSSVLFINDGSTDGSQKTITRICNNHDSFDYIQFDKNYGLSTALKAGFDAVKTEFVGYIDADLQTHPEDFNTLLDYIEDYHLVTGNRTNRKDTLVKHISSRIANRFRKLFTKDGISDTGCPLKIIHTKNAKRIPMFRGLHRFLPAMIQLQNGRIKEVPVRHFPRVKGTSKFGLYNRIFGPLVDCFVFLWMKKRYINYTYIQKKI